MTTVRHPMTATTAELVERATRLANSGGRTVLGITGAPGAGKSTLTETLQEALGDRMAALAGMDAFHLSNSVLTAHGSLGRKGAIDTFDAEGYAVMIGRLANAQPGDGPIYVPVFDRAIEESINNAVEIRADIPLVITEGNYLLAQSGAWPQVRRSLAEVWYLAPTEEQRHAWLIARHEHFGRSPADARQRALGSDEANAHLVHSTAASADLIIRWAR